MCRHQAFFDLRSRNLVGGRHMKFGTAVNYLAGSCIAPDGRGADLRGVLRTGTPLPRAR